MRFRDTLRSSPIYSRTDSVADPHHLDADPDPSFHFVAGPDTPFYFDADPDPNFSLVRIWILLLIRVLQICEHRHTDPRYDSILNLLASTGLHGSILNQYNS
jgi:hypothetical protein